MVLHSALRPNRGFTMIEVLIAVALLAIIFSLGLFISFDFYKSYSARSERDTIVSILQKARSLSMNNVSQTGHRVQFTDNPLTYTILPENLAVPASYGIYIASPALPFEISFDQLRGSGTAQTITLNNGDVITINSEGQISW